MNKVTKSYRVFTVLNYIFMALIVAVCLVPFLHTLAKALNDGNDTMRGGVTIFPRVFTLQNFKVLLADTSLYSAAGISILSVISVVISHLAVQFMAAYALSHADLPGRKKIMLFTIIPTFISGGTIPSYILYVKLGLLNNFLIGFRDCIRSIT